MTNSSVDLSKYSSKNFNRGKNLVVEVLWKFVSGFIFEPSLVHAYALKRGLLRLFGAKIGAQVFIKPRVRITFPWKLAVGENSWIGEEVWIDNLEPITIGKNAVISQRAYLCAGNHDYFKITFDLRAAPIQILEGAWVGAGAIVGPGVTIQSHAVLMLGGVATSDLEAYGIYRGNPATKVKTRSIQT